MLNKGMSEIKYFWLYSQLWKNNSKHMPSQHICWNVSMGLRCSPLSSQPLCLSLPVMNRKEPGVLTNLLQCQDTRGNISTDVPTDPERGRRKHWIKFHWCKNALMLPSTFSGISRAYTVTTADHTHAHTCITSGQMKSMDVLYQAKGTVAGLWLAKHVNYCKVI